MAELLNLEIFDRLTASASRTNAAFISFERSGTINFSAALAAQFKLSANKVVSFARSQNTWYIGFGAVTGSEGLPLRIKTAGKASLVTSSSATTQRVLATSIRTEANSLRMRITDEQATAQGLTWHMLKSLAAAPEPVKPAGTPAATAPASPETPAAAPASSIISPKTAERLSKHREQLQGGTQAPQPVAATEPATTVAAPLVRADKASDDRLQVRYDVLVALPNPNQDEARELGRISGELRRRKEAVNG